MGWPFNGKSLAEREREAMKGVGAIPLLPAPEKPVIAHGDTFDWVCEDLSCYITSRFEQKDAYNSIAASNAVLLKE